MSENLLSRNAAQGDKSKDARCDEPEGFLPPDSVADLYLALMDPEKLPAKTAEKPKETEQKFDYNGKEVVLKSRDGVNVYFKDERGEWDSKDGKMWIRRNSDENDVWHGTLEITPKGSLVEHTTAFGITVEKFKDGSFVKSMTNDKGLPVKFSKLADGTLEYEGTNGKWISKDGNASWTKGQSVYHGRISIDEFGRYCREPIGQAREIVGRSRETAEIEARLGEIEKNFNVKFGEANTQYQYDYLDPATEKYRKVPIYFRLPDKKELEVLEECLNMYKHVVPESNGKPNFDGMRINMVSGKGDATKLGLWGWYMSQEDGKSQVYFGPGNARSSTEFDGLRGTALHEIAHHLQYKLWSDTGKRVPPQSVVDFFGFAHDPTSNTYRMTDKNGGLWARSTTRAQDKDGNWYYRGRWYPVVEDVMIKEESRAKTDAQLRADIADDKKPCSNYFTNPIEAHAEAMSMLLYEPKMLWSKNPKLYEATRKWDQDDLNRHYGFVKDGDGKMIPKMMRDGRGVIVPNTPEARKERELLEKRFSQVQTSNEEAVVWRAAEDKRRPEQSCC